MFARPTRKKRGHGSNLSSTIGDNSSTHSMELDDNSPYAINQLQHQHQQQFLSSRDTLAPLPFNNQLKSIRRSTSNNTLRPPISSLSYDGIHTKSPQIHFNLNQRRSISGNYTPPKTIRSSNLGLNNGGVKTSNGFGYTPAALPKNFTHFKNHKIGLSTQENLLEELIKILNRNNTTKEELNLSLNELRGFVLKFGIPDEVSLNLYFIYLNLNSFKRKPSLTYP